MKHNLTRLFAVLLVTILCIASVPTETCFAAAAKKATKGTNKITISPKKASVNIGKTKKITIKLNKKQTKDLKIQITSSKKSVAKAPASVTVKKNKAKVSFKVKGLGLGTSNVKATLVTSDGKRKIATAKITVKEDSLNNVELGNTEPWIGDTLTTEINLASDKGVSYVWYSGDTADNIITLIDGEKGNTLKVTEALADKYIKVVVSDANNHSAEATTTKAVQVPIQSVSLNSATPKVNYKLTATISPDNASGVTYKWYSVDIMNSIATPIAGVSGNTLEVTEALLGKFIKVVATDANNKSVESATTTAVQADTFNYTEPTPMFVSVLLKAISLDNSTPKVGNILTAKIDPSNADGVTYVWYSGDSASSITTAIDGETESTLNVTAALAGKFIKVVATDVYKNKVEAATTTAVPVPLESVTLNTEAPKINDTLTATISPANADGVTYAWYSGDTADSMTAIEGATESTLNVTAALAGKFIKVVVTDLYNGSFSAATTTAVPVKLVSVSLPIETPKVGDTLTATISPANVGDVTYAWYSGDTADSITTAIDDATGNTLDVTESLAGKYIKVVATDLYTNSVTASTTTAVPVPLVSVSLPTETPKVGDTLTATISPANAGGVTYAWYSGDTDDIIETVIDGATGSTLEVTADLAGKFIKVVVTDLYDSSFEAATTTAVPIPLQTVSLSDEAPKVGDKLTATIGPETATDVTYVWYSGDTSDKITTVIEKATENTLNVTEALAGKFIKVVVTDLYDSSFSAATTTAVPVPLESVSLNIEAPKINDTLTAVINPEATTRVTYAWYSGDTDDIIETVIDGATGKTLDVTADLAGKYIKVVATDLYNNSFEAATTAAVPIPLESVSLNTEAPKINDTLTALIGPETATDVTYVWYSGDTSDKITTVIEKATENTLDVTEALAGKFIKVEATDLYGSSFSAAITTAVPVPLESVSLNIEAPKINDTLTAVINPEATTRVTYAWYSGDTDDIIETVIDGATGKTLDVTADLAGKYIKVVATDLYNNSFEAATTTAVPVPLQTVSLSTVAPKVSEKLTAVISPETASSVTYAWYSGDTDDIIETVIDGATGNALDVTADLAGKYIKVVATDLYDSSFEAATTTAVPVPLQTVSLSTAAPKVSEKLTAVISPEIVTEVTYAWYSGDTADSMTAIEGATGNTLNVTGDLTDKYIKVVATDLYSSSFSATTTTAVELDKSAGIVKATIGNDVLESDVLESDDGEKKLVLLSLYDAKERLVNDLYIINSDYGIEIVFPEVGAEIVKIDNNIFISIDPRYYECSDEPEIIIRLLMTEEEVCNFEWEAPE